MTQNWPLVSQFPRARDVAASPAIAPVNSLTPANDVVRCTPPPCAASSAWPFRRTSAWPSGELLWLAGANIWGRRCLVLWAWNAPFLGPPHPNSGNSMWFPFQGLNMRQNYVRRRTEIPRIGHSNVLSRQFSWFAGMDPPCQPQRGPACVFRVAQAGFFRPSSK